MNLAKGLDHAEQPKESFKPLSPAKIQKNEDKERLTIPGQFRSGQKDANKHQPPDNSNQRANTRVPNDSKENNSNGGVVNPPTPRFVGRVEHSGNSPDGFDLLIPLKPKSMKPIALVGEIEPPPQESGTDEEEEEAAKVDLEVISKAEIPTERAEDDENLVSSAVSPPKLTLELSDEIQNLSPPSSENLNSSVISTNLSGHHNITPPPIADTSLQHSTISPPPTLTFSPPGLSSTASIRPPPQLYPTILPIVPFPPIGMHRIITHAAPATVDLTTPTVDLTTSPPTTPTASPTTPFESNSPKPDIQTTKQRPPKPVSSSPKPKKRKRIPKTNGVKRKKPKSEKTKSEKTKSEKPKSEKTKSEKTKSEKTKSEKTKSEKTKSQKTKSEKTKPEKTKPEKAKSKTKSWKTKSKKELAKKSTKKANSSKNSSIVDFFEEMKPAANSKELDETKNSKKSRKKRKSIFYSPSKNKLKKLDLPNSQKANSTSICLSPTVLRHITPPRKSPSKGAKFTKLSSPQKKKRSHTKRKRAPSLRLLASPKKPNKRPLKAVIPRMILEQSRRAAIGSQRKSSSARKSVPGSLRLDESSLKSKPKKPNSSNGHLHSQAEVFAVAKVSMFFREDVDHSDTESRSSDSDWESNKKRKSMCRVKMRRENLTEPHFLCCSRFFGGLFDYWVYLKRGNEILHAFGAQSTSLSFSNPLSLRVVILKDRDYSSEGLLAFQMESDDEFVQFKKCVIKGIHECQKNIPKEDRIDYKFKPKFAHSVQKALLSLGLKNIVKPKTPKSPKANTTKLKTPKSPRSNSSKSKQQKSPKQRKQKLKQIQTINLEEGEIPENEQSAQFGATHIAPRITKLVADLAQDVS